MTTLTATELRPTMQIRLGAIEVLKDRGFCQHRYFDQQGHVSLIGALRLAAWQNYGLGTKPWVSNVPAYEQVLHDLDRELGGQSSRLWADEFGRTEQQVIDLLRGVGA